MKKILLSSFVFSGILFANQLSYIPLNKANLANENGGEKTAIEAYSDGIGIYTVGKFQIDNKAMNELVFSYGEEAKKSGETLKEFVIEKGNNKEKELAEKLGNIAENISPEDGTPCDDKNNETINDKFINNICVGENNSWKESDIELLTNDFWKQLYDSNLKKVNHNHISSYSGLAFDLSQEKGLKKIEFYMTYTYYYGTVFNISSNPNQVNFGGACPYPLLTDRMSFVTPNYYNKNIILTIDYDDKKYWFQEKENYQENYTGLKDEFKETWTKENLILVVEDCNGGASGTFQFINIEEKK
jgi:hypothetical protein